MTLNQQITRSQLYHTQHANNLELSPDPCCLICYPIQEELPVGFVNFWNWFQNVVPSVHRYNANTLVAYQVTKVLRIKVQQSEAITTGTQGLFKAYKNILQTLVYRNTPLRTLGDLTYIITTASLITVGFTQTLDYRIGRNLVQGLPPLQTNQPLYRVVEHLRTAWYNNRTSRQRSPDPLLRTSLVVSTSTTAGPSTSLTTDPFPRPSLLARYFRRTTNEPDNRSNTTETFHTPRGSRGPSPTRARSTTPTLELDSPPSVILSDDEGTSQILTNLRTRLQQTQRELDRAATPTENAEFSPLPSPQPSTASSLTHAFATLTLNTPFTRSPSIQPSDQDELE